MKPSEISYILNNLKNDTQTQTIPPSPIYVDESLMLCTNNDNSISNERMTAAHLAPRPTDIGFLTKRPSNHEGSSSFGFTEELNNAAAAARHAGLASYGGGQVSGQQRRDKMPWNSRSAALE